MYDTVLKAINLDSSNHRSSLYALTKTVWNEFSFTLQVDVVRTSPCSAVPLSTAVLTHWSFTNA